MWGLISVRPYEIEHQGHRAASDWPSSSHHHRIFGVRLGSRLYRLLCACFWPTSTSSQGRILVLLPVLGLAGFGRVRLVVLAQAIATWHCCSWLRYRWQHHARLVRLVGNIPTTTHPRAHSAVELLDRPNYSFKADASGAA